MIERIELLDIISLKEYYQNLLKELKAISITSNSFDEIIINIFSSKVVKIFIIGDIKNKCILLQIEVFPTAYPSLENVSSDHPWKNLKMQDNLMNVLENQIKILESLGTLTEKGFMLDHVEEECFWYATKILETEPSEEFCELLNHFIKRCFSQISV